MKLITLSTGSKGNCYYLKPNQGKGLLIECGITFKEIKKGLNFDIENIEACLLSHEHVSDHAKCPQELINNGIPVYMSFGTAAALELNRASCMIEKDVFEIGSFTVKPFKVIHDCAEPFGFLIAHPEMGVMCFATDTKEINHEFDGVNHWLIEANYSEETMLNNLVNDELNAFLAHRVTQNHMSLESCMEFYSKQGRNNTKNVILIHLSDKNSNGEMFRDKWACNFGFYPEIAKKGMEVEL